VYGLEQNGVGLGKFSAKAPPGIARKVSQIERQIIAGKITNIPTTVK
jgi:basic membrane lipoprotein Med (substrate-binding protein (PBP1-ABC) superfamily)